MSTYLYICDHSLNVQFSEGYPGQNIKKIKKIFSDEIQIFFDKRHFICSNPHSNAKLIRDLEIGQKKCKKKWELKFRGSDCLSV